MDCAPQGGGPVYVATNSRIVCFFGGGCAFAGFDKTRRRGVVVLSNSRGVIDIYAIGKFLLESEWQSDRRPKETKISSQVYGSYVGQYQRSPDFALRMLMMRQFLLNAPKAAIYIPAGFCLAVLVVLLWRAGSFPQAMDYLGLRGPGHWSFGGTHCAGVEPRDLRAFCAFPARNRYSP